jgi:hypothetical protein
MESLGRKVYAVRDDHERLIAMPPRFVVGGPERTLITIEEAL